MADGSAAARTEKESSIDVVERLAAKLDEALDALERAKPFAKSNYQTDVFQLAETLMGSDAGMRMLANRALRFEAAGVFDGGPWEKAVRLQPPFVSGSLKAAGVYPVVEILSELRMLAIAQERAQNDQVSADDALEFLNEVLALNLEYLFPADTEQERIESGPGRDLCLRLFELLAEQLPLHNLRSAVISEIDQICAQRPIMTDRVRHMIALARRIPADHLEPELGLELEKYANAVSGRSPLSEGCVLLSEYREVLDKSDRKTLEREARTFADGLRATGLGSPQHAVLLRHLRKTEPELIPMALGLNDAGTAQVAEYEDFVHRLIKVAMLPATAESLFGFARFLERGLLSRSEVAAGLDRLVTLDFQTDVRKTLLGRYPSQSGVTANSILLAGSVAVFGQPLGVGQGRNPTCQAARGISLWAQHAPGQLINFIVSAARDGFIEIPFEGVPIRSSELLNLSMPKDMDLDPVSIVLVPHLNAIYEEMIKRVVLRQEDGHKWVNPNLYGRWIASGFASVFADVSQTMVAEYPAFVRRFYATHHPAFNDGHKLMYPNPVGLCVTNGHGDYLGPHAVSLQRVDKDSSGDLRAYFYNPNNEGRQDWGRGVKPSVRGFDEEEGESSLPFDQFVARLYAFHYNPYEEGDAYAVPDATVAEIEEAARTTWGKSFRWVD